jgi:hypothetical protein
MIQKLGLVCVGVLIGFQLFAQDTTLTRKTTYLAFPVAFRLPETGFGAGVAALSNFYIDKSDSISPPSQIQFGFAYTQNKQVLAYMPFQLFWQEKEWRAYGEIGFYKYSYPFYGVGTTDITDTSEIYKVDFPRLRLNALRSVAPNWYAGLRLWTDDFKMKDISGSRGGVVFGFGAIAERDTRNNVYYPTKGSYTEFVWHPNQKALLSDFTYVRYRVDYHVYFKLAKNTVLANQVFLDMVSGDPPFYAMAILGGSKRMRGIIEGRFRDRNALLLQTELRQLVYKRWGATAFLNYGQIAPSLDQLEVFNGRFAGGGGLRFMLDREKRINLRLDAAWGDSSPNFYFTVGEAF